MTVLRRLPFAALSLLVAAVVVGTALPPMSRAVGGDVVIVRSGSMAPAIPVGSTLLLDGTPASMVGENDIVTVRFRGDSHLTHRVVRAIDREDGRWFELRGDANPAPDPALVPASALVGRVAVVVPVAGYGLAFLATGPGRLALLSLGFLLILMGRLMQPGRAQAPTVPATGRRRLAGYALPVMVVALVLGGAIAGTAALMTDVETVDATVTTGSW